MSLQDQLDAQMRAQLRRGRPLPPRAPETIGTAPLAPPRPAPAIKPSTEPRRVPHLISDATMKRAANLEVLTVKIGVSLGETSARLSELETMLAQVARERFVDVRHYVRAVSTLSGIGIGELLSPRRARHIARPRQVIMYLAKKHLGLSLPTIGRSLGNRDHTTIMHGCRKIERLLRAGDPELTEFVAKCEAVIEKR